MDDIRLIIRERYDRMSKGERQLSDFILEAPSQILNMTAAEIAEASGVSSVTVVRYVKKLGAEKAVTAVRKARKIYILGMGTSYTVAYDLFHKLRRAGFDANCYPDLNMVTEFFHYLNQQDVVLAISYSGRSKEILYACEKAKLNHAKVIAITRNTESSLAELTPTYSVPPERAFGLLAGGDKAKAAEVLEKTGGRVREAIKLAE